MAPFTLFASLENKRGASPIVIGKCLRADPRAKLRAVGHRQFLGEGAETFMEDSGENAVLQDLTPCF